jgi:ABC-type cobalamin/Fe3+-siderophores transport system ATPase subunit
VTEQLENFEFRKQKGGALFVDYMPAPQKRVLGIEAEVICAGDKPILREVHLSVYRGDKIHLTGPNGIGKTTLLRAMVNGAHIASSRLLYLPQELGAADGAVLLDAIRALDGDNRARVLTLVATLASTPKESSHPTLHHRARRASSSSRSASAHKYGR